MERLFEFWARLSAWLRWRTRDRDFSEELSAHLDLAIADEVARGVESREARRRALLKIGGIEQAREGHRDARGRPFVESVVRDCRDAIRLLRRTPGVTAVAILSLALGIGVNTAIFSMFNSLVLRPLPVKEPLRLVELYSGADQNAWTYPLWEQIQARSGLFEGVVAWGSPSLTRFSLIDAGELQPLKVYTVSGEFFHVLGVQPALGRLLNSTDSGRGGSTDGVAAIISDAFWRRRFGASRDVLGKVLTLDRSPVTIIGITPPDFFGPEVGQSFDLILPMGVLPRALLDQRGFFWMSVVARLKLGQTAETAGNGLRFAQEAMRAATLPQGLRSDQLREYLSEPFDVRRSTGPSHLRAQFREPLLVIMAGVGLVLLIGCTNIASLLLARGHARRHEFSVRMALGASRERLISQLLIESVLLAMAGAAVGVLVATWAGPVLVNQLSTSTSEVSLALPLDWRVLSFTAATAIATALLVGLVPAIRATRLEPLTGLARQSRGAVGRAGPWRLGHLLVISQVTLSLVLGVGAALLVRTFAALATTNLGFDPQPVLIAQMRVRPGIELGAGSDARRAHVLEAVRSTPGVAAAAFSGFTTPMSGIRHDDLLENPTGMSLPEGQRRAFFRDVGVGWFDVMGMRLMLGRDFTEADAPRPEAVAIVNESLARRFFPGVNPVGHTLREAGLARGPGPARTIVGVVGDAVYNSAREGVLPALYRFVPLSSAIVIRTADDHPEALARDISRVVAQSDAAFVTTITPMADQVRDTVARERLLAILSGAFGVTAWLLAGIGVYGLIAYGVSRRKSEIAVRRALGASGGGIARLVLSETLALMAWGIVTGTIASLWLMPFLRPLLYGLGPRDPQTVGLAITMLLLTGLVAAGIPAWRASRVDPAVALREG